jgi:predicted dehydrogenase
MTNSLRWGILGTGGIAGQFISDLLENGFTVTAVGSRTQESADTFAANYGVAVAHGSYEALAADPNVDVIYVSTPHPFHAANARLALANGKHALVEKPFTMTEDEARSVVELAESSGLVVLEAMWTRWLPHMVRIREILAEGTLGEVRTVMADHNQHVPEDPNGRMYAPELGGGAILDLGIYPVSFAVDMLGEPTTVSAVSSPTATGVDRQTAILLEYSDGRQAVLHCALDTVGPNSAAILGTKGWLSIDSVFYTPTSFTVYDNDHRVVERFENTVTSRGMQYEAAALEALVASGRISGDEMPARQSVAIMGILDSVRENIGLVFPDETLSADR